MRDLPPPVLRGYSLWLRPESHVAEAADAAIEELAAHRGTTAFRAHVTLLGTFTEDAAAARRLARALTATARLRMPRCTCGRLETSETEFFRAAALHLTPDVALSALRAEARQGSDAPRDGAETFAPHLSLLYGHLEPDDVAAITQHPRLRRFLQTLAPSFACPSLELVRTGGPVASWQAVGSWGFA